MKSEIKPFDKLDEAQQRCCIDIAIGISIIASRIPTFNKQLFKDISDQWALCAELDENLCKYALTGVSTTLYETSWKYHVIKDAETMTCEFVNQEESGASNGEHP